MSNKKTITGSQFQRAVNCNASIELEKLIPRVDDRYTSEGTIGHKFVSTLMESYFAEVLIGEVDDYMEDWQVKIRSIPEGQPEMQSYALEFLSIFQKELKGYEITKFYVEKKVTYNDVVSGTPDLIVLAKKDGKYYLFCFDYKYGVGKFVKAEGNLQLAVYLVCHFESLQVPVEAFYGYIVQPRVSDDVEDKYSKVEWELSDIISYKRLIEDTVEDFEAGNLRMAIGEHCQFCPAKTRCPAHFENFNLINNIMEKSGGKYELISQEDKELVHILGSKVGTFIDAVQKENKKMAMNGHVFKNLKLVKDAGKRSWIEEKELEIAKTLRSFKLEPYKKPELISFSGVEKTLGKDTFEKMFSSLIEKGAEGYKLVRRTWKGEEVKPEKGSEFDNIAEEDLE